jgi:hypothetical protein
MGFQCRVCLTLRIILLYIKNSSKVFHNGYKMHAHEGIGSIVFLHHLGHDLGWNALTL